MASLLVSDLSAGDSGTCAEWRCAEAIQKMQRSIAATMPPTAACGRATTFCPHSICGPIKITITSAHLLLIIHIQQQCIGELFEVVASIRPAGIPTQQLCQPAYRGIHIDMYSISS